MDLPVAFSLQISSAYIALCGILMVVLAIRVGVGRYRHKVDIGDNGNRALVQIIRVHANATEYIPIALLLLVAVENSGVDHWVVHTLGSVLVVARVLHAIGLSRSEGASVPRFLGAVGSLLMILAASMIVLVNL